MKKTRQNNRHQSKLDHDPILEKALIEITPSPENDRLYRPVDTGDAEIIAMAESIRVNGVMQPLIITLDGYILSGHRRYAAAKLAGRKTVPCMVERIRHDDEQFLVLLREHNRQREKTLDEKLREEVVSANPDEAYQSLIDHRRQSAVVSVDEIEIIGIKTRSVISKAKAPFLTAVLAIIEARREFWPLSDRMIHYPLLNNPPLRHASKPGSTYANNIQSYKSLVDLLTRARLDGSIPWESIADPTRPMIVWDCWGDPASFMSKQVNGLFKGYWRDLLQSQPNHIEIVGEKNTIDSIIRPVAMKYCIPMTIGRGYSSLPPRYDMSKRFRRSGKEKLVVLNVSDFDPDGEEIAHSFARSMRDDFNITNIVPVKVALTAEQVREYRLPPVMMAKETSSNCAKFKAKHGRNVFELEALEPAALQEELRKAIDSVLDINKFNAELYEEKRDAAFLETARRRASVAMSGMANVPH